MPPGPKGQRRPADVIGNAIRVAQIAAGEAEEEYEAKPEKNEAAAELGRKGGAARAKAMTPEMRAKRVQCDEIWAFCGSKQKNTKPEKRAEGHGDVWTWTAFLLPSLPM